MKSRKKVITVNYIENKVIGRVDEYERLYIIENQLMAYQYYLMIN
jgi:hypothetical protein